MCLAPVWPITFFVLGHTENPDSSALKMRSGDVSMKGSMSSMYAFICSNQVSGFPSTPQPSPSPRLVMSFQRLQRAEGPGFESRLRRDFWGGRVIPVTSKLAFQWLRCQAPGVIGSALGLVSPVSVYCDWVG